MKAPMLSELGMDWLVEVTSERYYGPTTLGAINEFVRLGEVTPENFVINTCDGSRRKIQEITPFCPSQIEEGDALVEQTPAATGMSIKFRRTDSRSGAKSGRGTTRVAGIGSPLPRTGTTVSAIGGFVCSSVALPFRLGFSEF
jgi:hypothetical protein